MKTKRIFSAIVGAVCVATAVVGTAHAAGDVEMVTVIVVLNDAETAEDVADDEGADLVDKYDNVNSALMRVPANAVGALARNPKIASYSVDGAVELTATSFSPPWNLDRLDQASLPLDGQYTYADDAAAVTMYIGDTGILASHQEFGGRVAAGFDAIGDGQGTNDCNGHGTHVAGIAGGAYYGVAKAVTLVPVRVLGCDGTGTWSQVIAGLDWIVAHHAAGVPAVLNLSLRGDVNDAADAAVQRVIADGVVVAAASGNDGLDACSYSPSRVPDVLTVAATQSDDSFATFSNAGACVDLLAPGVGISSSYIRSDTDGVVMSGTSMSSPLVAGAAALAFARDRKATASSVVSMLKSWATPNMVTGVPAGTPNYMLYVPPTGFKLLSAANITRRK